MSMDAFGTVEAMGETVESFTRAVAGVEEGLRGARQNDIEGMAGRASRALETLREAAMVVQRSSMER